ncbi:MAG: prolipoprotein diacylglyceryl transferase [Candidatus Omnitrophica bacterium]|nr:prolipoprotein diacylglyceryl transferase [Candidatus Omnitrophota bacterium]
MFPEICQIGPFTVYSYGLVFAVGIVVCAALMSREIRLAPKYAVEGLSVDMVYDLIFWVVLGGILGARAFFIFLNIDTFLNDPLEIVRLQNGGLAWQGGLILGMLSAVGYIRKKKLPFLKTLDFFIPYVALGHAIGRIGCFLNGCCYGKVASSGIYFPVHRARLHPTQLYAAAALLAIFFILKFVQKKTNIPGRVLVAYLLLASLQRFIIEFFRGDHVTVLGSLSIFQVVAVCVFVVGGCLLLRPGGRKK